MPVSKKRKPSKKTVKNQKRKEQRQNEVGDTQAALARIFTAHGEGRLTPEMVRMADPGIILAMIAVYLKGDRPGADAAVCDLLGARPDAADIATAYMPVEAWGVPEVPVGRFFSGKADLLTVLYSSLRMAFFTNAIQTARAWDWMTRIFMGEEGGKTYVAPMSEALIWHYGDLMSGMRQASPGQKAEFDRLHPDFDAKAERFFQALFEEMPEWCVPVLLPPGEPIFPSKGDPLEAARLSGNRHAERAIKESLARLEARDIGGVVRMPDPPPPTDGGKKKPKGVL